jgi:molecular chaperone DnaK (HSP70)
MWGFRMAASHLLLFLASSVRIFGQIPCYDAYSSHIIVSKRGAKQMSISDFNRDGEVSSSEQAFGLGAILAALSETEAEVKITIKASTGGDEDYESMNRDELESLLEELQEQREDLEDEEPDDPCSDAYDEWEERCEDLDEKIEEIEELLDD